MMASMDPTTPWLQWEDDQPAAEAAITARGGFLRIILKTRDDPFFLARWIEHHAAIAGMEHLVVFDNMSELPEVLEAYRRYAAEGLLVIRFAGWCNDLHATRTFAPLYSALARSSRWFCVLDTDEFLGVLRGRRHAAGRAVMDWLREEDRVPAHPGIWWTNTDARDDRFEVGGGLAAMERRVRAGKPLLRCDTDPGPYINHNIQVMPTLFQLRLRTNAAVWHLPNLSRA